ncbi:hypothetical protein [Flagellimonas nanhaiensis]|uniref:Uncharacterized protein n=1 Tax=Flagellimonas nanhaiensis TaxID=2292706 RepID=A0A371JSJ5_9FLAO|nr:hypothetical protein [Allomuricauda nanhaiensis]RDY60778.1 hypothetical protein DX873_00940 [Allomuricauda nanhaiensis]
MKKIFIVSYNPSFNRLDFIKFIFENTENGLIESKKILDELISKEKVTFEIENDKVIDFIHGLRELKVLCEIDETSS